VPITVSGKARNDAANWQELPIIEDRGYSLLSAKLARYEAGDATIGKQRNEATEDLCTDYVGGIAASEIDETKPPKISARIMRAMRHRQESTKRSHRRSLHGL
jgi:hypothetical protein